MLNVSCPSSPSFVSLTSFFHVLLVLFLVITDFLLVLHFPPQSIPLLSYLLPPSLLFHPFSPSPFTLLV